MVSSTSYVEGELRTVERASAERVCALSWSWDGELLAVADRAVKAGGGGTENVVRTFSLTPGGVKNAAMIRGHSAVVEAVCWGRHHGKFLCSAASDGSVRLWDLRVRRNVGVVGVKGFPRSVSLSSDGNQGALVTSDGALTLFDLRTRSVQFRSKWGAAVTPDPASAAASAVESRGKSEISASNALFLPNGKLLVASIARGVVNEARLEWVRVGGGGGGGGATEGGGGEEKRGVGETWGVERESWTSVGSGEVRSLSMARDGEVVVSGSADGVVSVFDGGSGEVLRAIDSATVGVHSCAVTHDARYVAVAGAESHASLFPLSTLATSDPTPLPDSSHASIVATAPNHPLIAWGPVPITTEDRKAGIGIKIATPHTK